MKARTLGLLYLCSCGILFLLAGIGITVGMFHQVERAEQIKCSVGAAIEFFVSGMYLTAAMCAPQSEKQSV